MVMIYIYSGNGHCMCYSSHYVPIVGDYVLMEGMEYEVIKRVARVNSSDVNIHVRLNE